MNIDNKRDIYIWDAGRYGGLIAIDCECKGVRIAGFIDSRGVWRTRNALPLPVLTPGKFFKIIYSSPRPYIIIAVPNELQRKEVVTLLLKNDFKEEDFDLCSVEEIKNMGVLQRLEILKRMILPCSRKWIERHKAKFQSAKHNDASKSKKIIYIANEIMNAGGLTCRFTTILFYYCLSKKLKVEFKINWTQPADLTNFIIPNKYDWLTNNDIILNEEKSIFICTYDLFTDDQFYIVDEHKEEYDRLIEMLLTEYEQVVVTGFGHETNFAVLFEELFKPSEELQKQINHHLQLIGGDFISATFRFQQLLGDFKEASFAILKKNEQKNLINRCIEHLQEVHYENPGIKILVTSDSITFLNTVKDFDFVYTVPVAIKHIEYTKEPPEAYMKNFCDYFLLTHSKKIYLIVDGLMYQSAFAHRASLHNNVPYIVKRYNIKSAGYEDDALYPKINIKESVLQKQIYVWGAGIDGFNVLIQCKENNWKISAFLDSSEGKESFNGYKVKRPEQILNKAERDFFIIISSRKYAKEMAKICRKTGLKQGEDFWTPRHRVLYLT